MSSYRVGCIRIPVVSRVLEDAHGLYESDQGPPRIVLDQSLEGQQRALTILHELLHAASEQYALDLTERQVRALETALGQVICDNPQEVLELVREIQGG